ncbi:hypothetical protein F5Y01DRAFT_312525 [Xylaria sp. FL0043]|nr:hypothetical protein F5Y01DRAFT_312525 [Xylaria sp. FL0043]
MGWLTRHSKPSSKSNRDPRGSLAPSSQNLQSRNHQSAGTLQALTHDYPQDLRCAINDWQSGQQPAWRMASSRDTTAGRDPKHSAPSGYPGRTPARDDRNGKGMKKRVEVQSAYDRGAGAKVQNDRSIWERKAAEAGGRDRGGDYLTTERKPLPPWLREP